MHVHLSGIRCSHVFAENTKLQSASAQFSHFLSHLIQWEGRDHHGNTSISSLGVADSLHMSRRGCRGDGVFVCEVPGQRSSLHVDEERSLRRLNKRNYLLCENIILRRAFAPCRYQLHHTRACADSVCVHMCLSVCVCKRA